MSSMKPHAYVAYRDWLIPYECGSVSVKLFNLDTPRSHAISRLSQMTVHIESLFFVSCLFLVSMIYVANPYF